jgi:hypothetical protein
MGKLDIGVGDEFPVDEPVPPSPEDAEAARAAREEWRQQKDQWKAQARAWKEDMRAHRHAFKNDVKRSFRENFGPETHRRHNPFFVRALVVLGLIALTIALLPFLFMFGFVVLAAVLFFAALRHSFHQHSNPSQ